MIGVSTGGRISELLGLLRIKDVYQNKKPVTDLLYRKRILQPCLEAWYLQNQKKRMDIACIVKWLLTSSWAENPDLFRNAKTWKRKLQSNEEAQTQK